MEWLYPLPFFALGVGIYHYGMILRRQKQMLRSGGEVIGIASPSWLNIKI